MGLNKAWTYSEILLLHDLWGEKTIPQIAQILNRSLNAIKVKSTRLKLGNYIENSEYLNANRLANLMGIDIHTVLNHWIPKLGLKYSIKKPLGDKEFICIKFDYLVKWLKKNQGVWDSRRVEFYTLGQEFPWLQDKRKKDELLPKRKNAKWTPYEDFLLIQHYKQNNKTYEAIGKLLGRSQSSVKHRISRIDVWDSIK